MTKCPDCGVTLKGRSCGCGYIHKPRFSQMTCTIKEVCNGDISVRVLSEERGLYICDRCRMARERAMGFIDWRDKMVEEDVKKNGKREDETQEDYMVRMRDMGKKLLRNFM